MTQEQINDLANKFADDCAVQEGASHDDAVYLVARNMPTSHAQNCLVACVGENVGFVSVL